MAESAGIPLYFDGNGSSIADPDLTTTTPVWHPASDLTMRFMRAIEACRDLKIALEPLLTDPLSNTRKRRVKALAVPLRTLIEAINSLYAAVNAEGTGRISPERQAALREAAEDFRNRGRAIESIKTVRDKLAAHLDIDCIRSPEKFWKRIDFIEYMEWLARCLVELFRLLAVDIDLFAWSRDSGHKDVTSLMTVDGTLVDLYIKDGQPEMILNVTIVRSPKFSIASELRELVRMYNCFSLRYPQLPKMRVYLGEPGGVKEDITDDEHPVSPYVAVMSGRDS